MRKNLLAALLALLIVGLSPVAYAASAPGSDIDGEPVSGETESTSPEGASAEGMGGESMSTPETPPDLPPHETGAASGDGTEQEPENSLTIGSEAPPVLDSGPPPESRVTREELTDLLRENEGGAVTLTGDVEWSGDHTLSVEEPTVVEMGDYGIHIPPGAGLTIQGPLRFEGAGVRVPLFRCEGDFNLAGGAQVSAKGDGAVAVLLESAFWFNNDWASIRAEGDNATALRQIGDGGPDGMVIASLLHVEALGEHSVGIDAEVSVRLNQSAIEASGESVVSAGEIVLDGSAASPMPEGARVIQRGAVPGNWAAWLGVSVVTADRPVWDAVSQTVYYDLYDSDKTEPALSLAREAAWSGLPADLSVPGDYPLSCTPKPAPDWYPLEIPTFNMTLHVVEPDRLWLKGVTMTAFDVENGELTLNFLNPVPDAGLVEVFASEDHGKTWRTVCSETPRRGGAALNADCEGLRPDTLYLFQARVTGGPMEGLSNILSFPFTAGNPDQLGGGDRDDDDFGDQGEEPPPAEIIPPPSGGSEETGGTHGGTGGNSGGLLNDREPPPHEDAPRAGQPEEAAALTSTPDKWEPSAAAPAAGEPPAPPQEAGLLLTPAEIAGQLEANGSVTLIDGAVRAVLPSELLESVWLSQGEVFAARLALPAPDVFEVRFWAGNRELSDLGGAFTVSIPCGIPPDAEAACKGADETEIAADSLENGRASFTLTKTGSYTVLTRTLAANSISATPVPEPSAPARALEEPLPRPRPLWPAVLGGAVLLAGGVLALRLYRRKGGKRE